MHLRIDLLYTATYPHRIDYAQGPLVEFAAFPQAGEPGHLLNLIIRGQLFKIILSIENSGSVRKFSVQKLAELGQGALYDRNDRSR